MIPNLTPYMFAADFNCPGGDILKLDGTGERKDDPGNDKPAEVHLNKVDRPLFSDNWDEVIENYPQYAVNPKLIREVEKKQNSMRMPVVPVDPPAAPVAPVTPAAPAVPAAP